MAEANKVYTSVNILLQHHMHALSYVTIPTQASCNIDTSASQACSYTCTYVGSLHK